MIIVKWSIFDDVSFHKNCKIYFILSFSWNKVYFTNLVVQSASYFTPFWCNQCCKAQLWNKLFYFFLFSSAPGHIRHGEVYDGISCVYYCITRDPCETNGLGVCLKNSDLPRRCEDVYERKIIDGVMRSVYDHTSCTCIRTDCNNVPCTREFFTNGTVSLLQGVPQWCEHSKEGRQESAFLFFFEKPKEKSWWARSSVRFTLASLYNGQLKITFGYGGVVVRMRALFPKTV